MNVTINQLIITSSSKYQRIALTEIMLFMFEHFMGLVLKGCVRYIFASLFCLSKRKHL